MRKVDILLKFGKIQQYITTQVPVFEGGKGFYQKLPKIERQHQHNAPK